jgi:hypothetical protein
MGNKEATEIIKNDNIQIKNDNIQINTNYTLTKKASWFIGTYFLGFLPMIFLYGLLNMCINPSLKYMNIMLSTLVFYYFGFIELAILGVSLGLLYLNNNYGLIKNRISKILFFYNSLKANKVETSINLEFEIVYNIINKINKYEILLNKYFEYLKQFKLNKYISLTYIHFIALFNKYISKLEYLLNNAYHKIHNICDKMTYKIKGSTYVVKTIEPVINVINDVIQDKTDIEMQDEYINTKQTLDMIKNDIDDIDKYINTIKPLDKNNIDEINNTKKILDLINDIDNKSLLDGEQLSVNDEFELKFKNMENEIEHFDNLINELNKMDQIMNDKSNKQTELTEEEIIKSLNIMNLFGKMMKITELPQEDKEKCKKKIKEEIMDTTEFMNLLNSRF